MSPKHRLHTFDGSLIRWCHRFDHLLAQVVEHIELLIKISTTFILCYSFVQNLKFAILLHIYLHCFLVEFVVCPVNRKRMKKKNKKNWNKKVLDYLYILVLVHSKDRLVRIPNSADRSSDIPTNIWIPPYPMRMCWAPLNLSVDLPRKVMDIGLDCMWVAEMTNYL